MLTPTPTPTTPNFNCNSPPFLIKIKRRAKNNRTHDVKTNCKNNRTHDVKTNCKNNRTHDVKTNCKNNKTHDVKTNCKNNKTHDVKTNCKNNRTHDVQFFQSTMNTKTNKSRRETVRLYAPAITLCNVNYLIKTYNYPCYESKMYLSYVTEIL